MATTSLSLEAEGEEKGPRGMTLECPIRILWKARDGIDGMRLIIQVLNGAQKITGYLLGMVSLLMFHL